MRILIFLLAMGLMGSYAQAMSCPGSFDHPDDVFLQDMVYFNDLVTKHVQRLEERLDLKLLNRIEAYTQDSERLAQLRELMELQFVENWRNHLHDLPDSVFRNRVIYLLNVILSQRVSENEKTNERYHIVYMRLATEDYEYIRSIGGLLLQSVERAIHRLEENPKFPALRTHKANLFTVFEGKRIESFHSYAQASTPAAYRIVWHYGHGNEIIVERIIRHLNSQKSNYR